MNKAIFLDRDGILIEDVGYPFRPEHLALEKGILPYLRELKRMGFLLIIVTNQSGIARGKFTVEQYRAFQNLVERALASEGVEIDAAYYCPFHPAGIIEEYAVESECRKPAPGMILQAAADFDIDISQSIMIGDKESDRIHLPGLRSYIIRGRYDYPEGSRIYDDYQVLLNDAGIFE